MRRWLLVGAGAQGRVVLEALRAMAPEDEIAFADDEPTRLGQHVLGARVVSDVASVRGADALIVLTVGHNLARLALAARLEGVTFGVVVHPSAVVAPSATLAPGAMVLPGALVHTGAVVGSHAIVNTGAALDHDGVLGEGASLAPGVRSGGRVSVGRAAFVSTGVVLAARAVVGEGSIVGAGSVVVREVPARVVAYGCPARPIRAVRDEDWSRAL